MRVGNTQTRTGESDPKTLKSKETSYVIDYLSGANNDLMTDEKGFGTTRVTYGHGYQRISQKVTPQPAIPATPEAAIAGTTIGKSYFKNDHLGSPLFAANEQGEVLRYAERGPWGDLKVSVQEHLNWAGVGNSLQFTNYQYDPVIEKYFAQARFYDARQGRMLAIDPMKTGPNRYRYCQNNPMNYVDPDGEVATAVVVAITAATEAIVGGAFRLMDYIRQQQESGKRIDLKEAGQALISGMGQGAWNGLTEAISPIAALCEIGKIAVGIIGRALHDKVTTGKIDIGNITREVLYDRYGGRPEPKPAMQPVVNSGTQGSLIEKTKAAIIPSPRSSVVPTVSRRDPKAGCEKNVSGTGKGYDYGSVTPTSSLLDRWQDRWSNQNTMMGDLAMVAMVAGGGFGILKAGKAIGTVIRNQKNLVGVAGKVPGQVLSKGGSKPDIVYRALNTNDAKTYTQGNGLIAKNPNGNWTLKDHLVKGSSSKSYLNDPYISTTKDLSVAQGFNRAGNNLGIVKIDLNKVPNPKLKGYEIFPRVNGVEGLPYHYSIWQQETSVFQRIPHNAIIGFTKK